jgi:hypothetical protein
MLANPEDTSYFVTERVRCSSTAFISMVNKFGNENGFLKILETIKHEATSINYVYYLVDLIGHLSENLHKSFLDRFLEKLRETVEFKLLNMNEQTLRILKRERIEELVNTLWDKIMARLFTHFDS